jgi:hypothetical protein
MPVILTRGKEGDGPVQVIIVESSIKVLKNPSAQGPERILSIASKLSPGDQEKLAGGVIISIREEDGDVENYDPPAKMIVTSGSIPRSQ